MPLCPDVPDKHFVMSDVLCFKNSVLDGKGFPEGLFLHECSAWKAISWTSTDSKTGIHASNKKKV